MPPTVRITWPEPGRAVARSHGRGPGHLLRRVAGVRRLRQRAAGRPHRRRHPLRDLHRSRGPRRGRRPTIEARAHDAAGNVGTDSVSAVVDTVAPVLVVREPAPGTVTKAATLRVAGTVTDATPVTLLVEGTADPRRPRRRLLLRPAARSRTTARRPSSSPPPTTPATPPRPPSTSSSTALRPTCEIVTPADGAAVGSLPVVVQGLVQDATETTVTVDGVDAVRTGTAWTATIATLVDGPHTFDVVATDAAGNVTTRTPHVVVDLAPPVVAITTPPSGAITREAAIVVRGHGDEPHAVDGDRQRSRGDGDRRHVRGRRRPSRRGRQHPPGSGGERRQRAHRRGRRPRHARLDPARRDPRRARRRSPARTPDAPS